MSTHGSVHHAAVVAFWSCALVPAVASQNAVAQSSLTLRNVRVDVSPLRANAGEQTASWAQRDLSVQLARALAAHIAPTGASLTVRIDYLSLSSGTFVDCGSSRDNISGVAIIGGVQTPVRATTSYQPSPSDQTMVEQSNHDRVSQLTRALAYWIAQGAFF
jgi:hypothetical protein